MLGCSKGAWQAAEYVLHAPERLAKAIWLSPALVVQGLSIRAAAASGLYALPVMLNPTSRTVAAMMRWLQPAYEREDKAGFGEYVDGVALGLQCLAKLPMDARARVLRDDELGAIRIPVLYVAGEDEKLSSVAAGVSRLHRVAPQIEAAVFPGAGHDLLLLQQAAIAKRMLEFLDA